MRLCMNFYLNFHRFYEGSKLIELSNLLHKKHTVLQSLSNLGLLLHKMGFVETAVPMTVHCAGGHNIPYGNIIAGVLNVL